MNLFNKVKIIFGLTPLCLLLSSLALWAASSETTNLLPEKSAGLSKEDTSLTSLTSWQSATAGQTSLEQNNQIIKNTNLSDRQSNNIDPTPPVIVTAQLSENPSPARLQEKTSLSPENANGNDLLESIYKSIRAESRDGAVLLSLRDAIAQAVQKNWDIKSSSFKPLQAEEDVKSAESVYDLTLFEKNNFSRVDRPTQGFLDNGSYTEGALTENRWDFQVGMKKTLQTGGGLSLYTESDHLDSSSSLVTPNPQYTSRLTAQFNQPLLREFGDSSNQAAIEIANRNVTISNEVFRQNITDVIKDVVNTYWQLSYNWSVLQINKQSLDLASEVYRREKVRQSKGITKPIDVERAFAVMKALENTNFQTANQVSVSTRQLRFFLGSNFELSDKIMLIIPDDRPLVEVAQIDSSTILKKSLEDRPEIQQARKNLEIAEIRKQLAAHKKLPRLDAKFSYSLNGLGDDFENSVDDSFAADENTWLVGLELEVPLGNRKAEAEYRREALEYERAATELNKTVEFVTFEVNMAIADLKLAGKEILLTKQEVDAKKKVVNGEKARFELAQITNDELFRAQEIYSNSQANFIKAVLNYNIKLLNLSRAKGTLLDEFDIDVESLLAKTM